MQRLPFPVVEKSAHWLRRLSGGRLLPYLRISLQVSVTSTETQQLGLCLILGFSRSRPRHALGSLRFVVDAINYCR